VEDHDSLAVGALVIVVTTSGVPVVALIEADKPQLAEHGVALGIGGLLWGCLIEVTGIAERTARMSGKPVFSGSPADCLWGVTAFNLGMVLLAAQPFFLGDANVKAALLGAGFVALADLVSIAWCIPLAQRDNRPLGE
jgi:hypothetical protein